MPLEFAAKPSNLFLQPQTQQGPETKLNRFALRPEPGDFERVAHQLIVNHNVGPHDVSTKELLYTSPVI